MPPLPIVTFSQALNLVTMWYCVDWWTVWWVDSEYSFQINVFCVVWLQLIPLIINKHVPSLFLILLFRNQQFFTLLLCTGLSGKYGSHCSGFSCKTSFVMFWLADAGQMTGSQEPSIVTMSEMAWKLLPCTSVGQQSGFTWVAVRVSLKEINSSHQFSFHPSSMLPSASCTAILWTKSQYSG